MPRILLARWWLPQTGPCTRRSALLWLNEPLLTSAACAERQDDSGQTPRLRHCLCMKKENILSLAGRGKRTVTQEITCCCGVCHSSQRRVWKKCSPPGTISTLPPPFCWLQSLYLADWFRIGFQRMCVTETSFEGSVCSLPHARRYSAATRSST